MRETPIADEAEAGRLAGMLVAGEARIGRLRERLKQYLQDREPVAFNGIEVGFFPTKGRYEVEAVFRAVLRRNRIRVPWRRSVLLGQARHPGGLIGSWSEAGSPDLQAIGPAASRGEFQRAGSGGQREGSCRASGRGWRWASRTMAGSGRPPSVAMMQAPDFGNLDNPARLRPLDRPAVGRILLEGEVSSRTVIVRQVPGRDPVQVAFVQNEDVVEALAPHGADEAAVAGAR